jgi:hypothetical protein
VGVPESTVVVEESPDEVVAESPEATPVSSASDESPPWEASLTVTVPESPAVVPPPELLLLEQPAAAVPIPTTTRTWKSFLEGVEYSMP